MNICVFEGGGRSVFLCEWASFLLFFLFFFFFWGGGGFGVFFVGGVVFFFFFFFFKQYIICPLNWSMLCDNVLTNH